jgi:hypothetical protein
MYLDRLLRGMFQAGCMFSCLCWISGEGFALVYVLTGENMCWWSCDSCLDRCIDQLVLVRIHAFAGRNQFIVRYKSNSLAFTRNTCRGWPRG